MKSRQSIGALAARAGLRTSAIRYYEERGVLAKAERVGGKRVYPADAVDQLERIALAQAAGFSLEEIRLLERGLDEGESTSQRWRRLAAAKLREVDAQLERLRQMRALLHDALRCDCGAMSRCPLLKDPRVKSLRPGRRVPGGPRTR